MKLYLQSPKKLINYAKDYCDGFVVEGPLEKELKAINKPILFMEKLIVLNYNNHTNLDIQLLKCGPEGTLFLSSDLDVFKHGWRFDLALRIRQQFPNIKFGLLGIADTLDEVSIFQKTIGCEVLITWWPISIGLAGRDLGEEWPQLKEPSYNENISDVISKPWLTYILNKFKDRIDEMEKC